MKTVNTTGIRKNVFLWSFLRMIFPITERKPLLVFRGILSVGDWREEVPLRNKDNSALRLWVSTIPTEYRFHTFLEDRVCRISMVTQNTAYNRPTQDGFYFGPELRENLRGYILKRK